MTDPSHRRSPAPVVWPVAKKRPLGLAFYILCYAPIAISVTGVGLILLRRWEDDLAKIGGVMFLLNVPGMLICAIICGVIAGKRRTTDFGMLMFVGLFFIYAALVVLLAVVIAWGAKMVH